MYHSLTGSQWDDLAAVNRHNSRNGRWYRLADAPFSPRAYMAHHLELWPIVNVFTAEENVTPRPANCTILTVYGGETRYACNSTRLGVCSVEIWELAICRPGKTYCENVDEDELEDCWSAEPDERVADLGLTFTWSRHWIDMPGTPRCSFIPIFERRQRLGSYYQLITGVGGGQQSYNDTTCQAEIVTLDDLWFGLWPGYYGDDRTWMLDAPLPFEPRRSVLLDDALMSTDELYSAEESPLDKSVSVAGGIRYTSHRFDPIANRSIVTAAEMYSDVWTCQLLIEDYRTLNVSCNWHYSYPDGRTVFASAPAPSGSLPFPLTHTASALFPAGRDLLNMRIGGATSAEAVEQLARLRIDNRTVRDSSGITVRLPLPPISLLRQPGAYRSRALPLTGAVSVEDVTAARRHLSHKYVVREAELNSVNASFHTGSDLLLTHTLAYQQGYAKALFSTWDNGMQAEVGGSPGNMIDRFPLRRVDHSMASTWDSAIITGGQSGVVYYNDWLTFEACVCFWPDDPSYEQQLGPMLYRGEVEQLPTSYRRYWRSFNVSAIGDDTLLTAADTGLFRAGVDIEVSCAPGWHFHPPLASDVATVTCAANSLWLDVELGAVRRCVRDELHCEWPWVDAGYTTCVDPLPVVDGIEVVTAVAVRREQPVNSDAATVVSVPAAKVAEVSGDLMLVVHGRWLTEPITITVGAAVCARPSMRNTSYFCSSSRCVDFAQSVICLVSGDVGVDELVSVTSGRGERATTLSSLRLNPTFRGRVPLTLSTDEPHIVSLTSRPYAACSHSNHATATSRNATSLTDCSSLDGPLVVEVCGLNLANRQSASTNELTAYVNVTVASELVPCINWTYEFSNISYCTPKTSVFVCFRQLLCGLCTVAPVMSKHLLTVAAWSLSPTGRLLTNIEQQADPLARASITFSSCAAGSYLDINTTTAVERCAPCQPGYYSPSSGSQQCIPCWIGSFSARSGSITCGNLPCPVGADCYNNGSMYAHAGYYLTVLDKATGQVGSLPCLSTACSGPVAEYNHTLASESTTPVDAIGLEVVNYCGANRRPSADNVMCAECVDQYSEVRGVCVYCPGPSYGSLVVVLLLTWLLVYALHRSTLHMSNNSTVPILVYFIQMSALFLPANLFAPLSLANLQLFSDALTPKSVCLLPLHGMEAFISRVLSPLLVFVLLAALMFVQLLLHRLLVVGCVPSNSTLKSTYFFLFPPSDGSSSFSLGDASPAADNASAAPLSQLRQPLLEMSQKGDELKAADESPEAVDASAPAWRPPPLDVAGPDEVEIAPSDVDDDPKYDSVPVLLRGYRCTFLRLLVFSYNTFATAALSFFHTRRVGEDDNRLWEYPAVGTTSAAYRAMRPIMAMLIAVLVAVIPLLIALLYYFHRREQQRLAQLRAGVVAEAAAVEDTTASNSAKLRQRAVLVEVMLGTFRPSHWPLAVMVVFRRLLLTTIAIFVVTASYVWLTAVNTALLVLHISTWPYRNELDNRTEALTLTLLVVQTTLLNDWLSDNALVSSPLTPFRSVLLWLLLPLPFVFVLAGSVQTLYLRARERALSRNVEAGLPHIMASAAALMARGLCSSADHEHPISVISIARLAEHGKSGSLLDLSSP